MRSPSRKPMVATLLLLGILAFVYILVTPGLKPVVASIYEPPIISVENRVVDIGRVKTDDQVNTAFLLYNVGGKYLHIAGVDTSCGCTVAKISKKVVAPGDFTRIQVRLDTRLKLGRIRKEVTIHSNDPKRPGLPLFVVGEVLGQAMQGHAMVKLQPKDRLALFKGSCATCHVDAGKGKSGKALFLADCAMCHGARAQGNHVSGPSLLLVDYEQEAVRRRMRAIIAEGSPHSPQMPPFSKARGGPLTDDEIDSLVNFLKFQAMQNKMGLLTQPDQGEDEDQAAFEDALKQPH